MNRHDDHRTRFGPGLARALVALVAGLLVALAACSQRVESGGEKENAAAPPAGLPGKVVKRTPPPGADDPGGAGGPGGAGEPAGAGQEEAGAPGAAGAAPRYVVTSEVSDDPAVRREIANLEKAGTAKAVLDALVRHKEAAVPALRLALRHKEQNVRIQAAQVLSRLADPSPETTTAFVSALRDDPNQEVRAAVGRALTQYEDPALVEPLLATLAGDSYEIARANAAWALGAQGDRAATDGLVKALEDDETWVRLRSLSAIKRLRAKEALPAVLERLKDENSVVRERAVQTLQKLTGKRYGESYEKWKRVVK